MRQRYKTASFDLPHAAESNKLHRVLSPTPQNRTLIAPCPGRFPRGAELPQGISADWDAEHFNLHQAELFQQATPQQQTAMLQLASFNLLQEACALERASISYMKKMALLAETTKERLLYTLFSAEATYHLAQILRFLPRHQRLTADPFFFGFLANFIEREERSALLFPVQVVLKGFGFNHYCTLARDCLNPQLAGVLTSFLPDESRHQTTGLTLFKLNPLTQPARQIIVDALGHFVQRVKRGPQGVVAAVEGVFGPLSRDRKLQLLEQIQADLYTATRLKLLYSLIAKEKAGTILEALEARNVFAPLGADLGGIPS